MQNVMSISISLSDKTNYAFVNNLTGAHFISEHHGYKKVNTNKYFTSSIPKFVLKRN